MIRLALETSTRDASVALLDGDRTLGEATLGRDQQGTALLLPTISNLLKSSAMGPDLVQQICVSTGPGSFTGLRMGIATAKTWAWANKCEIVGVPTHRVIAGQACDEWPGGDACIASVIDAQRNEWFVEVFALRPGGITESVQPSQLVSPQEWLDSWQQPTLLNGPGLSRHHGKIRLAGHIGLASHEHWRPRAVTIGQLAHRGEFPTVDPFQLKPVYGRKSAAEEKLETGGSA